jgi:hypothetical protein
MTLSLMTLTSITVPSTIMLSVVMLNVATLIGVRLNVAMIFCRGAKTIAFTVSFGLVL